MFTMCSCSPIAGLKERMRSDRERVGLYKDGGINVYFGVCPESRQMTSLNWPEDSTNVSNFCKAGKMFSAIADYAN